MNGEVITDNNGKGKGYL